MKEKKPSIPGRGASENPPNRFETLWFVPDHGQSHSEALKPNTRFLRDTSRSIITTNDSPDVGFDASINPYRGCEHGCIYCYARPTHEYLGFSAGLDFETKILVKEAAPKLLRHELSSKHWRPKVLAISGVTDPYQPVERHLLGVTRDLTRSCLKHIMVALAEFLLKSSDHNHQEPSGEHAPKLLDFETLETKSPGHQRGDGPVPTG